MQMTSALANKVLKKLNDDKEFWLSRESNGYIYVAAVDEEPVIPDYDYAEVSRTIAEIDDKIVRIKHAINCANATNIITVGNEEMTADMILVRMAQLNNRMGMLDRMRKTEPKSRRDLYYYNGPKKSVPEYQYINYDLEQVRADYEKTSRLIAEMQIALDKYNQTVMFDVDVEI